MDYWIKCAARWQREFMVMKSERDHLLQLLKMHRDAAAQVRGQHDVKRWRQGQRAPPFFCSVVSVQ